MTATRNPDKATRYARRRIAFWEDYGRGIARWDRFRRGYQRRALRCWNSDAGRATCRPAPAPPRALASISLPRRSGLRNSPTPG